MARVKQTATKSTGGKAPRFKPATKSPRTAAQRKEPPATPTGSMRVLRDTAHVHDDGYDYPCQVRGLNESYPDYAEVKFRGIYYIHVSQITQNAEDDEPSELPVLPHREHGIWIQHAIDEHRKAKKAGKKVTRFHCGYCFTSYTTKRSCERHAFGDQTRGWTCQGRANLPDHEEIRSTIKCPDNDSCPACLHPKMPPAAIVDQERAKVSQSGSGEEAEEHVADQSASQPADNMMSDISSGSSAASGKRTRSRK